MDNRNHLKPIDWQLHMMMAKRRIKSNVELQRRLQEVGYEISSTQIGRLVDQRLPPRLTLELLRALITVLNCGVQDLLVVSTPASEEPAPPTEQEPPQRRRLVVAEPPVDVTGPEVKALPRGPRE
ncbi:helix-turn-helix domain-containing protein [Burkholderia ubonensis]|uniref:helix-turn-helix domain-containing protein n=1 Tax=Burkholderia ubonensis TaxID=101571 RepID=UPI0009B30F1B|nr:helix-turn-helix transcriptional regulator [Burkholderia ubonensis]